ncbi:MAG: hypothetical protein ACLQVM_02370 [Terriglobia bacterium]
MSKDTNIRHLQEGYQPRADEVYKGYRVRGTIDMNNLKIPTNLGTAAVTPQSVDQQIPASSEHKK